MEFTVKLTLYLAAVVFISSVAVKMLFTVGQLRLALAFDTLAAAALFIAENSKEITQDFYRVMTMFISAAGEIKDLPENANELIEKCKNIPKPE